MIGIELIMKDGTKDWVDPVEESEFDEMVKNATTVYSIKNTYNVYDYDVDRVEKLVKYELHPCCGYDSRRDHSTDCMYWGLDDE